MTHPPPIVFVVDDEPSVLKAVSRLIRSAGHYVRAFSSAREFMECQPWEAHGCVVLDMEMPGGNGLDVQQAFAARGALLPIIFLTGHADVPSTIRAMRSGATDFLTKPVDGAQLLSAVNAAIAKDRSAREATSNATELHRLIETLSPREYEVFTLVASGLLNKQTAAQLGTAEKTIKVHRARVMEKLKVDSLAGLVRLAERAGVASISEAE
jgi:FixJ family two-component response regulator